MTKKRIKKNFYRHPSSVLERDVKVGEKTKIWHFAQIRQGTKLGKNCIIANSVFIDVATEIGDNVKIQNHAIIYHKAIIDDDVFIGPNVCFTNDKIPRATNVKGELKDSRDWQPATIKIGKGASVGAHSVILPGVEIGQFAMVGAGSVVSKNVPSFALAYGNPARVHGFVCQCGQRIKKFNVKGQKAIGKCSCGLVNEIEKKVYQSWKKKR